MRRSVQETDGKDVTETSITPTTVRPHSPTCSSSSRTESESGISSSSSFDATDPPVYVSLKDYRKIKKSMEEYKRKHRLVTLESDGSSFRSSSEEKSIGTSEESMEMSRRKRKCRETNSDTSSTCKALSDSDISESGSITSGSSNSSTGGKRSKVITAEKSLVPNYSISCCNKEFGSPSALYAHLRNVHNVGTSPQNRRRCKLCKMLVNEDLVMLHIELFHTISDVRAFRIDFGFISSDGGKSQEMYMELLPDQD